MNQIRDNLSEDTRYTEEYIWYFYSFLDESQIELGGEWKEKLNKVFKRISKSFDGKMRQSWEPYITHLIEVTKIFIELAWISNISFDDIIIALLHDSIEDIDHENFRSIQKDFGDYVALWVLALSKPENRNKKARNKIYYGRFGSIKKLKNFIQEKASGENISLKQDQYSTLAYIVAKVKICDRIHNLRTMNLKKNKNDIRWFTPEKKQEKIQESIKYFSKLLHEIQNIFIVNEFQKSIMLWTQALTRYKQENIISSS